MNVLDRIVEATREEVGRRRRAVPLGELERHLEARGEDRPFREALAGPGVSIIAEHKRRSPSAGEIRRGRHGDRRRRGLRARRRGRAVDPHRGPALRRGAGGPARGARRQRAAHPAQGLRRRRLPGRTSPRPPAPTPCCSSSPRSSPRELRALFAEAAGLDLDVVVEVHDEEELACALEVVDADVIGINNRDLTDFTVDLDRTYELLSDVPAGKTVVSESGIHSRDQLDDLERVGVDAVLIGETFMRADDPELAVRALGGDGDDAV